MRGDDSAISMLRLANQLVKSVFGHFGSFTSSWAMSQLKLIIRSKI